MTINFFAIDKAILDVIRNSVIEGVPVRYTDDYCNIVNAVDFKTFVSRATDDVIALNEFYYSSDEVRAACKAMQDSLYAIVKARVKAMLDNGMLYIEDYTRPTPPLTKALFGYGDTYTIKIFMTDIL